MPRLKTKTELMEVTKKYKLGPKEAAFVEHYVQCHNGSKAVTLSGYSRANPPAQAAKLLNKPNVQNAIYFLERKLCHARRLTSERVVEQLFFCLSRSALDYVDENGLLIPISELPKAAAAAIDAIDQTVKTWTDEEGMEHREVVTKLKLVPKAPVIDMALKFKGLYQPEKVEVTAKTPTMDWNELYEREELPSNVIDVQAQIKSVNDPSQALPKRLTGE